MWFTEVLEYAVLASVILGLLSQVVFPLATGRPAFPMFRPEQRAASRLAHARARADAAAQRLEEARQRKIAAEKNVEAARLEAQANELDERALDIRLSAIDQAGDERPKPRPTEDITGKNRG